jgi:hypothetical protein
MEPAGMVHALEKIRELLQPDGRLIDIHPSGEPPPIEVRIGQQATVVGWMRETDDFIEYAQASAALSEAVQRGWFDVERKGTFEFATHADSISDLREYLAKEWKDAILEEIVGAKAEELLSASERVGEVLVREHVCIARLRPGDLHGLA